MRTISLFERMRKNSRLKNVYLTLSDIRRILPAHYTVLDIIPDTVKVIHSGKTHLNFLIIDTDMLNSIDMTEIAETLSFNAMVIVISDKPAKECKCTFSHYIEKPFTKEELIEALELLDYGRLNFSSVV
jgi:two-component SAPR family response regulator